MPPGVVGEEEKAAVFAISTRPLHWAWTLGATVSALGEAWGRYSSDAPAAVAIGVNFRETRGGTGEEREVGGGGSKAEMGDVRRPGGRRVSPGRRCDVQHLESETSCHCLSSLRIWAGMPVTAIDAAVPVGLPTGLQISLLRDRTAGQAPSFCFLQAIGPVGSD